MANYVNDDIDFNAYMAETDAGHRVVRATAYGDEMKAYFRSKPETKGACLPWRKTRVDLRFRDGETTLWSGFNGSGKSQVLGQATTGFMAQGMRVCVASMEMKPQVTLARMCRQASASRTPDEEFQDRFIRFTDRHLWLYDQLGAVHWERLLAVIRYCTEKLKIQHFIIDSFMKCGIAEDDYTAQKRFVDQLCAVGRDSGCHIHLVAHSRKGMNEMTPPGKMDVKGSGSITDQVDNVITVWRNKRKEQSIAEGDNSRNAEPDTLLICDKQRNGEWEGKVALWFDPISLQYCEDRFVNPIDLMQEGSYL